MATERQNFEEKNHLLRNHKGNKVETLQKCLSDWCFLLLLVECFHCCASLNSPLAYNGKRENWSLLLSHCRYFDESFTEMASSFFSIVAMATERFKC